MWHRISVNLSKAAQGVGGGGGLHQKAKKKFRTIISRGRWTLGNDMIYGILNPETEAGEIVHVKKH